MGGNATTQVMAAAPRAGQATAHPPVLAVGEEPLVVEGHHRWSSGTDRSDEVAGETPCALIGGTAAPGGSAHAEEPRRSKDDGGQESRTGKEVP
jgi:hypothetical protein